MPAEFGTDPGGINRITGVVAGTIVHKGNERGGTGVIGASNISFLELKGGPPSSKPISVKVRGDDYEIIKQASGKLKEILQGIKGIKDISDDASLGRMELTLKMNHDVVRRAGINPLDITRTIRLLVDGEVVAEMQDKGEKLQIRVKADSNNSNDIGNLLKFRMPTPSGASIPLNQLVTQERGVSLGNIRHYNFKRAITLEADIAKLEGKEDFMACRFRPAVYGDDIDYSLCALDTVTANKLMLDGWAKIQKDFPRGESCSATCDYRLRRVVYQWWCFLFSKPSTIPYREIPF